MRFVPLAEEAPPAGAEKADDDTVARADRLDGRTHRLDDASGLVTVDGG